MNNSYYKVNGINNDTLIVSFAGNDTLINGIKRFEFLNFLEKNFNNIDKHFYIDHHFDSYHKGISGISNNIDQTIIYLKNEIKKYKNVIFLGASSGGYASILFGSLLNINHVIAFIPQTIRLKQNIDEKYRDISGYINNTTQYYIYGDTSISNINDVHHISHCERIAHHPNVFLTKKNIFKLKIMRDNGELYNLIYKVGNLGSPTTPPVD